MSLPSIRRDYRQIVNYSGASTAIPFLLSTNCDRRVRRKPLADSFTVDISKNGRYLYLPYYICIQKYSILIEMYILLEAV